MKAAPCYGVSGPPARRFESCPLRHGPVEQLGVLATLSRWRSQVRILSGSRPFFCACSSADRAAGFYPAGRGFESSWARGDVRGCLEGAAEWSATGLENRDGGCVPRGSTPPPSARLPCRWLGSFRGSSVGRAAGCCPAGRGFESLSRSWLLLRGGSHGGYGGLISLRSGFESQPRDEVVCSVFGGMAESGRKRLAVIQEVPARAGSNPAPSTTWSCLLVGRRCPVGASTLVGSRFAVPTLPPVSDAR